MKVGLYAYPVHGKKATNAAKGLKLIIDLFRNEIDVLIGPEYSNVSRSDARKLGRAFSGSSNPEAKLLIPGSTVVEEYKGKSVLPRLYNRVYITTAEGIIHEYDQRLFCVLEGMTMGDHYACRGIKLGRGLQKPRFIHDGSGWGIDVCADNSRRLCRHGEAPALANNRGIEFHVIIASGMSHPENFFGRYTLFCEGGGEEFGGRPIRQIGMAFKEGRRLSPAHTHKIGMEVDRRGKVQDRLYVFDLV